MICLQETKCSDAKLPAEVTGKSVKAYPHKYWFPASSKEGYSGVALWSKKEPLAVTFGFKGRLKISFRFFSYFIKARILVIYFCFLLVQVWMTKRSKNTTPRAD